MRLRPSMQWTQTFKKHFQLILGVGIATLSTWAFLHAEHSEAMFGGEVVTSYDQALGAHHTVLIIYPRPSGYMDICTGAIISSHEILTAAHCVTEIYDSQQQKKLITLDPSRMRISFLLSLDGNVDATRIRKVTSLKTHPKWKTQLLSRATTQMYDLAVLTFEGDLPAEYSPAELVNDEDFLIKGMQVHQYGFGSTGESNETLQNKQLKTVQSYIEKTPAQPTSLEVQVAAVGRRGTCTGDSGGPAFIQIQTETGPKLYLWGILSQGHYDPYGDPYDPCGIDSVYTRVLPLKSFFTKPQI